MKHILYPCKGPPKHTVTTESSADSNESYLQAVCTCGWKGRKHSNMGNWQMHEVSADAYSHILKSKEVKNGRIW